MKLVKCAACTKMIRFGMTRYPYQMAQDSDMVDMRREVLEKKTNSPVLTC